jgi:hypothetical protein
MSQILKNVSQNYAVFGLGVAKQWYLVVVKRSKNLKSLKRWYKMAKRLIVILDHCNYRCINFDTEKCECKKTGRALLAIDVLGPDGFPSDCPLQNENEYYCLDPHDGFYCALDRGHTGNHETVTGMRTWPQEN